MMPTVLDCDAVASAPNRPPTSICRSSDDSQTQTQSFSSPSFSPPAFYVSSAEFEGSAKTLRESRSRASSSSEKSMSSSRSRPRSILINTEPVVQVTPPPPLPGPVPAASIDSQEVASDFSASSPSSSESELQTPATDDSSRATLPSSASSSCIEAEASIRTRTTTLSSTSGTLCVTFAPLPEIGPRQRKSSRPLGLAARGEILRQRRMMMVQNRYDEGGYVYPGEERLARKNKEAKDKPRREEDDVDNTEVAIAALGKAIGDATKSFWRRVKSKNNDSLQKRPKPARGFTWPGRSSKSQRPGHDSDNDSESDIEGLYSRRKDEDPMTKTIMEGSDEGLDHFVLAYDTVPVSEDEEEDVAHSRADEELRAQVEEHLVNGTEG